MSLSQKWGFPERFTVVILFFAILLVNLLLLGEVAELSGWEERTVNETQAVMTTLGLFASYLLVAVLADCVGDYARIVDYGEETSLAICLIGAVGIVRNGITAPAGAESLPVIASCALALLLFLKGGEPYIARYLNSRGKVTGDSS